MNMPTHIVAVGGIVKDDQDNVLLVKTQHDGWVFPGGQVEVGENLLDALLREVKEESGIDIEVVNLIGVYSNTGVHKWYDGITDVPTKLMLDYICKPTGGELTPSEETPEVQWLQKNEAMEFITSPAIRERYQAFLEFEGQVTYMDYVTHPEFVLKEDRKI